MGDQIAAYELISGTRLWMATAPTRVEPATGDDLVFVVEPAAIVALRATDGSRAWELPFAEKLAVPPVWDNGWLVVATAAGEVLALRATDGQIIWRRDLGAPLHGRPAFAGDRVYLPMSDSRAVALRVDTGAPVWERRLGGAANDVLALDDRIYLGSQDKYMYCLNAEDGDVEWRWLTGGPVIGQPVVDENTVFFVSLDNVLRALNRSSGVQRWKRALPLRPVSGPLKGVDALVVTGASPVLRAYKLRDGAPAGELAIAGEAGEVVAPPRLLTTPSLPLPILIAVTREIVKGWTVVALTRSVEPAVTAITPLPNLIGMTPPVQP